MINLNNVPPLHTNLGPGPETQVCAPQTRKYPSVPLIFFLFMPLSEIASQHQCLQDEDLMP